MAIQLLKHRFTVDQYHRMAQAGILAEGDQVELLAGEIIEMSPIGRCHAACVNRLNRLFSQVIGERAIVSVQNPVYLSDRSEPQPDLALLQFRWDYYAQAHPRPEEILLLIEVAETSIEVDRQVKVPLYARSAISEVWLVDLVAEGIEVYRKLTAQGYQVVQQAQRGQSLSPQALPDLEVAVADVLG